MALRPTRALRVGLAAAGCLAGGLAAALAAGGLTAGAAWAGPSFACAQARLPIEQALCADTELGNLEGEMSRLYQQRLAAAGRSDAKRLRNDMGLWLAALTKDCEIPRAGTFGAADVARVHPCLAARYRERIAALQPPAAAGSATEPPSTPAAPATAEAPAAPEPPAADPATAEPAAAEPAPAAPTQTAAAPSGGQPVPEAAIATSWRALPFDNGVVAIIAQEENQVPYATASIYCDSAFKANVPVFLYRLGSPVPTAAEVDRLNRLLEGVTLKVDGATVETADRRDIGESFSGLRLLPDGTLSYMLLIDPKGLEAILHGSRLEAALQLPADAGADRHYAVQSFPLKNSRKAIEAAMRRCL